jgi:Ulp1 family protease
MQVFITVLYVFIPINIRKTHWYLAVIHARNMEIQVLDSLGSSQDRKDLTDSMSMHKLNNYEFNINLSQSLILFYNI